MKRAFVLLLTLFVLGACSSAGMKHPEKVLSVDENLNQQALVVQKLHLMQHTIIELNALETEGMSKRDIERVKRAVHRKVEQLLEEAKYLIEVM